MGKFAKLKAIFANAPSRSSVVRIYTFVNQYNSISFSFPKHANEKEGKKREKREMYNYSALVMYTGKNIQYFSRKAEKKNLIYFPVLCAKIYTFNNFTRKFSNVNRNFSY
jgi:hypothetical protein